MQSMQSGIVSVICGARGGEVRSASRPSSAPCKVIATGGSPAHAPLDAIHRAGWTNRLTLDGMRTAPSIRRILTEISTLAIAIEP